MKITKEITVCISIAERPGNFGSSLFNAAFKALNLNYIYVPFRVQQQDLSVAIAGIRAFNIRGCGVSMPHKIAVIDYLDQIDVAAKKIGAVNTIVNNQGSLMGYNTDYLGAQRAVEEIYPIKGKKVLIHGAGGAARAMAVALTNSGAREVCLTNRHDEAGKRVANELDLMYCSYHSKGEIRADLLVNATSVGMTPNVDECILPAQYLDNYEAVMDLVIYPSQTKLLQLAQAGGKIIITGQKMALYQAAAQFEMYTGQPAPLVVMKQQLEELLK